MPESTLSLTIDDLRAEIGKFLGYGRGATKFAEAAWTTSQLNDINVLLKSGLSQVYTPPPLAPGEAAHEWSFLRPQTTLTLESGKSTVDLPADFGGFSDSIFVMDPASVARRIPLRITHVGMLEQQHASQPDTTGFPRMACEKVLPGTGATQSTRSQLLVWPTSDGNYTLSVSYKHMPDALTGGYPYPPGGAEHAELFKASVIAAAELQLDDQPGPRAAFFVQRLAASIAVDRRRKGLFLGYNGDRSDWRNMRLGRQVLFDNPAVTYNGDPL